MLRLPLPAHAPARASTWLRGAVERSRRTRSWRLPLAATVTAAVLLAIPQLPVRPFVVTTASVPVGLYVLHAGADRLLPGDTVAFEYQAPDWARGRGYAHDGAPFAKYVFGVPGDVVTTDGLRYRVCNSTGECRDAGSAQRTDRAGRVMHPVDFGTRTVIPAGSYYLGATLHERSYDSRYYGLIPAERVLGRISPVWLWQ